MLCIVCVCVYDVHGVCVAYIYMWDIHVLLFFSQENHNVLTPTYPTQPPHTDATPIPHAISNASLTSAASSSPGRGQGSSAISLYKLEALASSAVRAVAKVQARLLICFGSTGRTASLIAKYRPPVPIYTVVVHKAYAGDAQHASFLSRQLHFIKGVVPVLAAPDAEENEGMLQDAIVQALQLGFIAPGDSVVCIMALRDNMVLKVCVVGGGGGVIWWGCIHGGCIDMRCAHV